MPRFFVPSGAFSDSFVSITGDDAHHIARSLRMREGDEITVCDMQGNEHRCRLTKIRDDEASCEILETKKGLTESPVELTLFMAYPKGDKLETVIQKAVELGVSKIVPFESSRCIKRPKAEKADKQTARLVRIAEEAAKQCGRSKLTAVEAPIGFDEAIAKAARSELALFCYEGDGAVSLKRTLNLNKNAKTVSLVVGSEGGFSLDESKKAVEAGLLSVNLGPRILRCETAPVYALSAISYFFELEE